MKCLKTGLNVLILAGLSLAVSPAVSAAGDHFLCDDSVPDPAYYQAYRWYPHELPIKVYIPPMPFAMNNPGMYMPLVQKAFTSWTAVAPAMRFSFVSTPAQASIRVEWREHFPEEEATWGVASLPRPYIDGDMIRHTSTVKLAVKAQPGSGMGSGAIAFSGEELLAIATHEVGHALGLRHSSNLDDLMGPYMFKFTADRKWGITQRDINTLYALYALPKTVKVHPCKR